jgi:arylsulfatase A-like enzyme
MKRLSILLGLLLLVCDVSSALAFGKAKHVVVVVWDGMRPDFISESNCPTLFHLASSGVMFANNHPVYISTTEVNGTAIATGAYPGHDGIIANAEFRPEIDPLKPFATQDFDAARKGDSVSGGHYVLAGTVAEILRQHGMKTAIAGAKPVALLHDRKDRPEDSDSVNLFAGRTLPTNALPGITQLEGAFPAAGNASPNRNEWTTSAVLDVLWKNEVPAYTLIWMSEPDATQHASGPGSGPALAAIKNVDDNLARVLLALDKKGIREQTDIMLVSDHGFSTIEALADTAAELTKAGFNATHEFKSTPAKGDIMVVPLGGSVLVYVTGHDEAVTKRAVEFFQKWQYTGVIFTSRKMAGTFSFKEAHINSPTAPDIIVSFRWNGNHSGNGTPGLIASDAAGYHPGQGMHGSLCHYDMHNTLAAQGPDFKQAFVDQTPSGNVDVGPTALWLLGVKPAKTMDGRVLVEALSDGPARFTVFDEKKIEATRRFENSTWHQYLKSIEVDNTTYFLEGNGELSGH